MHLRTVAGVALVLGAGACTGSDDPLATAEFTPVELTIAALHQALDAGEVSCRQVVQAHLDRIDAFEPRINAITVTNPRAVQRADSADAARAAGEPGGPLRCVPMLVKDNFDTHDMITTGGSIALRESLPPDDAFMVRKVREAGAIVIAKTNMAEWAFSPRESVSSSFDTTRNAYALDRTPAGSSGGTASGVAAAFGLIGLGSDTGNSIRGPSSHLSLVGIRSTIGLTSRDGVIPLSFDRDIAGPMGRTVEDVARVFGVIAGYDPADPYTEAARARAPVDYLAAIEGAGAPDALAGTRVAVLRGLVPTGEDIDPEIAVLFEAAMSDLEAIGAEVVELNFDLNAARRQPNMFCRRFRYDMARYLESLGPGAPIRDVVEVLESGEHHPSVQGGLESFARYPADVHPAEWEEPCPDFEDNPGRQAFRAAVVDAMDQQDVDVVVYPSWLFPPAPIHDAVEQYRGDNSQVVAPATGLPAITVPMGFTPNGSEGPGLPAGLQILGRAWSEADLFRVAAAYEATTRHRRPPPGFEPPGGD